MLHPVKRCALAVLLVASLDPQPLEAGLAFRVQRGARLAYRAPKMPIGVRWANSRMPKYMRRVANVCTRGAAQNPRRTMRALAGLQVAGRRLKTIEVETRLHGKDVFRKVPLPEPLRNLFVRAFEIAAGRGAVPEDANAWTQEWRDGNGRPVLTFQVMPGARDNFYAHVKGEYSLSLRSVWLSDTYPVDAVFEVVIEREGRMAGQKRKEILLFDAQGASVPF